MTILLLSSIFDSIIGMNLREFIDKIRLIIELVMTFIKVLFKRGLVLCCFALLDIYLHNLCKKSIFYQFFKLKTSEQMDESILRHEPILFINI